MNPDNLDNPESSHYSLERELRGSVGLMLLKPDTINLGVEEFIINLVTTNMIGRGGQLSIVKMIDGITDDQLQYIYPTLAPHYFRALSKLMIEQPSVLLVFVSSSANNEGERIDLWEALTAIKGKVDPTRSKGFNEGVRSAIPIPGRIGTFNRISSILQSGEDLSETEYLELVQNLAHTPENIHEFAGLLQLLSLEEITELASEIQVTISLLPIYLQRRGL